MKNSDLPAPLYLETGAKEIKRRYEQAWDLWKNCSICPRECSVNRQAGEKGECGAAGTPAVSGYGPHFGEESVLVGRRGSGTIFFIYCNLSCVYCQNWTISRGEEKGETVSSERLSQIMVYLQRIGCHNINLITPTPHIPLILSGVCRAVELGVNLPLVYNCGGYEKPEVLKLLEGIIDIYMPDVKYGNPEYGYKYSGVLNYPRFMKESLKEMQRQVGDLQINKKGIAQRGLLVRHLVLPQKISGTAEIVKFLAEEISPNCAVNIMDQYYPAYLAHQYPELSRRITGEELTEAVKLATEAGLRIIT